MDNKPRDQPAIPSKISVGSEESNRLKELGCCYEKHLQNSFLEIITEAGLDIADSTGYKVIHEHHNLFHYKKG